MAMLCGCKSWADFAGPPSPPNPPTPVPTSTPTPTATPTGAPTATPGSAPTPTPDPGPLRDGLVLNELCVNPVTTDNIPDGIVEGGDSAVELFNHSEDALDLDGRLSLRGDAGRLAPLVAPGGKLLIAAYGGNAPELTAWQRQEEKRALASTFSQLSALGVRFQRIRFNPHGTQHAVGVIQHPVV